MKFGWILFDGIPRSEKEFDELAAAQLQTHSNDNKLKGLLVHLYETLTVIDNKANALLTHNSLWIALLALFASSDTLGFDKQSVWQRILLMLLFGVSAVSSGFALFTVYVRWSVAAELKDPKSLALALLRVRATRTVSYRAAHLLSSIGLVAAVIFISCCLMSTLVRRAAPGTSSSEATPSD